MDFEYTHDLRRLIALAGIDEDEAPFDVREAVDFTEYAVPLRYEDLLDAEPLDRDAAIAGDRPQARRRRSASLACCSVLRD